MEYQNPPSFEFERCYGTIFHEIWNLLTKIPLQNPKLGPYVSKGGKKVNDFRWPIKKSIQWGLIQASRSYLNFFQISEMSPFLAPANTVQRLLDKLSRHKQQSWRRRPTTLFLQIFQRKESKTKEVIIIIAAFHVFDFNHGNEQFQIETSTFQKKMKKQNLWTEKQKLFCESKLIEK